MTRKRLKVIKKNENYGFPLQGFVQKVIDSGENERDYF